MNTTLAVVGVTVLGWWLGTGIVLLLNHLPRRTHLRSMTLSTALMLGSLAALPALSQDTSLTGLFLSYLAALLIWGWLELSYLMGYITGPHRTACPADATPWRRFRLGIRTSLYHELCMLGLAGLTLLLTGDGPNRTAAWCFVLLWLLRWSAKLNLFLGVRNFNEHWLPDSLRYLGSYMRQRRMNGLFPVSLLVGLAALALLAGGAAAEAPGFDRYSRVLPATLLGLGLLEHCFLMLPLRDGALWEWAFPCADERAAAAPPLSSGRAMGE